MKHHNTLSKVRATILATPLDYFELSQAVSQYRKLVEELTAINLQAEQNRQNIEEDGIAVGTTWAAMCLNDMLRTKYFIQGVAEAIEDLLAQREQPIQIVYAGTGPYATLILPLLTRYSPEQLQLTLLEINAESYRLVNRLFEVLNFTAYVRKSVCTNAITYQFDEGFTPDLIISETMQNGLRDEHQVPIMLNLLSQVKKEVKIIPECVTLKLGAVKHKPAGHPPEYHILGELMRLDQENLRAAVSNANQFSSQSLEIKLEDITHYHQLAILTDIKVYQQTQIDYGASGLTLPNRLYECEDLPDMNFIFDYEYRLQPIPKVNYKLIKKTPICA